MLNQEERDRRLKFETGVSLTLLGLHATVTTGSVFNAANLIAQNGVPRLSAASAFAAIPAVLVGCAALAVERGMMLGNDKKRWGKRAGVMAIFVISTALPVELDHARVDVERRGALEYRIEYAAGVTAAMAAVDHDIAAGERAYETWKQATPRATGLTDDERSALEGLTAAEHALREATNRVDDLDKARASARIPRDSSPDEIARAQARVIQIDGKLKQARTAKTERETDVTVAKRVSDQLDIRQKEDSSRHREARGKEGERLRALVDQKREDRAKMDEHLRLVTAAAPLDPVETPLSTTTLRYRFDRARLTLAAQTRIVWDLLNANGLVPSAISEADLARLRASHPDLAPVYQGAALEREAMGHRITLAAIVLFTLFMDSVGLIARSFLSALRRHNDERLELVPQTIDPNNVSEETLAELRVDYEHDVRAAIRSARIDRVLSVLPHTTGVRRGRS